MTRHRPSPVRRTGFLRARGSSSRSSVSRRLVLEGLEPRLLLDTAGWITDAFSSPEVESDAAPSVANQILVKLREGATPVPSPQVLRGPATALTQAHAFYPLSDVLIAAGAASADPVFPALASVPVETGRWPTLTAGEAEQEDGQAADRAELGRWYRLDLAEGADLDAALAALGSMTEVEVVEPNYELQLADIEIPPVIEGLPDGTTDPDYGDQWFHASAKIPNAWDYLNRNGVYPGGKRDVVVAVIDSGVDATHPELAANLWVNPGEIPGNNLDDDNNGFKDDIHGASVVSNPSMHSGDSIDYHGHGTHVAGIIAAQAFNQRGGVGVAFNVQIMAVRAAQYSGVLTVQDISEGILYAVDNGADVINMSFGGYVESQVVEDALEVALNQAVLVASAGNDGGPQAFPANLPYVLGVAASTPDRKRAWFSNVGDIMAPGESIYSTLPGNQYAEWSGTSMAAPVVSGIAALMRSYFWQRDVWSSRFIMGSIAASGSDPGDGVVDAYRALTEPPKPGVSLTQTWLFDKTSIAPKNDGDGRIDSGETVHLGAEFFNRSGQADHVIAILEAYAPGAVQADPYVTIVSNTVILQGIGPFASDDNGLIYNAQGVITGVEAPFVVRVAAEAPNDHVIHFVMTIYFEDGWDPQRPIYQTVNEFEYIVQRGRNLPSVIDRDMVLTADQLWIVGGPVLVEPGVTLRVEPGAQVQWGAISSDPYNPGPQTGSLLVRGTLLVQGTEERPVSLFPSYLVAGQRVYITVESGNGQMFYVNVRNPYISGFRCIDHAYFDRDAYDAYIGADYVSNTIFHRLSGTGLAINRFERVVFSAGGLGSGGNRVSDSVFLQDNENNSPLTLYAPLSFRNPIEGEYRDFRAAQVWQGDTYVSFPMEWTSLRTAEMVANYFGGHVASVRSEEEEMYLRSYAGYAHNNGAYIGDNADDFLIGLTDDGHPGTYTWTDGSPVTYTNWAAGNPATLTTAAEHVVRIVQFGFRPWVPGSTVGWYAMNAPTGSRFGNGGPAEWWFFILRLPGEHTLAELNAPLNDGRMIAYLRDNMEVYEENNAFLSKYWDPVVTHWMRVTAPSGASGYSVMRNNFWGTESTTIIDHAIVDYYDNFTTARVEYKPFLTHGAESTFPFVERVLINGLPAETVPEVGAGPTEFLVLFNRDMDPAVQPFATFGPSPPHTDFRVHPDGLQEAVFTVRLTVPASQTVTVAYATREGTALEGEDFEPAQGTLTFAPGETEKTVRVSLRGDWQPESDKSFSLLLAQPVLAGLTDGQAAGAIRDDDALVSISDAALLEGDSGTRDAVFTVRLTKPLDGALTVRFETHDGTAQAGADYQATAGTLTLTAGEIEKAIRVPILGDVVHEEDKTFRVELFQATRGQMADRIAEGTIQDDDPLLSVEDGEVVEGNAGTRDLALKVRLSATPRKTITVNYAAANGTAVAGEDYQATSGTLTFVDGGPTEQTVIVPVLGDATVEFEERLFLDLSSPVGAPLGDSRGEAWILADDGPVFSINDVSLVEKNGPVGPWSTYLGGNGMDAGYGVAVDAQGNVWTVGTTYSSDLPIVGGFDNSLGGGSDGYVMKFSSLGQLLWSTYLGGDGDDTANDIAIDSGGNVWAVGVTLSSGWAVGGFDTSYGGQRDAFVLKLSSTGQFLWSSYLGGGANDYANGVTVDALGNAWISGVTGSSGWVSGGSDTTLAGTWDAFLVKVATDGQHLWSGYLGGTGYEDGVGVATDADGNGWVVGVTSSSDWVAGGADVVYGGGSFDGFVAKVGGDGQVKWSSYLGGDSRDELHDVGFDPAGNAWLVGQSNTELLVAKWNAHGTPLWTQTFGGSGDELGVSVAVLNPSGDAWVTGITSSSGWISGGYDTTHGGGKDAFVAKIHSGGQLVWSSYFGSSADDQGGAIAVDPSETVWLTGDTKSSGWVAGGPDLELGAAQDAYLVRAKDYGITDAMFTVTLSEQPAAAVSLSFATADATAVAGKDYRAVSGTLTFEPGGVLTRTISVPVIGDEVSEPDEQVRLVLNSATVPLADRFGVATIRNDDPLLSIDSVSVVEGNAGTVQATLSVSISLNPYQPVTVGYATVNDTAVAGTDYQATSGTLTFSPGGSQQQTITVSVTSDTVDELDEKFAVVLSNAVGATISTARGEVTIMDDDSPTISIADAAPVAEGDSGRNEAAFTVTLSAVPLEETTVAYRTVNGTATAGSDYRITTGMLRFTPGGPSSQAIRVPVWGDPLPEPDERFTVNLTGCAGTWRVAGAESSKPQRVDHALAILLGLRRLSPSHPDLPALQIPIGSSCSIPSMRCWPTRRARGRSATTISPCPSATRRLSKGIPARWTPRSRFACPPPARTRSPWTTPRPTGRRWPARTTSPPQGR